MKKIVIFMLCIFMLFGCQNQKSEEDIQFENYSYIKTQLIDRNDFDDNDSFRIQLIFNPIDEQYRYDIIIDQPKVTMYDITAMSYANENDETMCPNIGIFDSNEMNLKKDFVDKELGFYKGIQLSGKVKQVQSIKVYVSYYTDEKKTQKIEKYIEVSEK